MDEECDREGNALPGDRIVRDKSGQGKNGTERRALTFWRPHREEQVKTQKKGPSDGHSHARNGIGRDKSGHGKNMTEREKPTFWGRYRNAQVRTIKKSDRARGTHELGNASRGTTQDKKRKQPRGTHELDTISGRTCQDAGTIRLSEEDSHPGDRMEGQVGTRKESGRARGTYLLAIVSGGTSQGTEECNRPRAAHQLETGSGGISQTMKRMRLSGALTS